MSLGTVDDSGVWVSDVIYIHDADFTTYWLSDPAARHSKAIRENPRVAATITVSNSAGEANVGLQIAGTAEQLKGTDLGLATRHRLKRKKPPPASDGEVEEGDAWYRLRPEKLEVIYEPLFGFEKRILELYFREPAVILGALPRPFAKSGSTWLTTKREVARNPNLS